MRIISIIKDPHIGFYCTNKNGTVIKERNINLGNVHFAECQLKVFVEDDEGKVQVFSEIDDFSILDCMAKDLEAFPITGQKITSDIIKKAIDVMVEDGSSESYARSHTRALFEKYGYNI